MKRIGIMGGTFDPIHLGHLNIAEQAYREYGLDCIWFMPSRIPPHKHDHRITSAEDRVAMVEAAIAPFPNFVRHIETWYHPEYVLKEIPFLAAQREDEETLGPETDELTPLIRQLEKKYGARIDILHCREMDISSADIRGRLREGKDVSDVLPGGVIDIIRDRKLYTEE